MLNVTTTPDRDSLGRAHLLCGRLLGFVERLSHAQLDHFYELGGNSSEPMAVAEYLQSVAKTAADAAQALSQVSHIVNAAPASGLCCCLNVPAANAHQMALRLGHRVINVILAAAARRAPDIGCPGEFNCYTILNSDQTKQVAENRDAVMVALRAHPKLPVEQVLELRAKMDREFAHALLACRPSPATADKRILVNLKQASTIADTPKKTLEGWKAMGKIPPPDVEGNGRRGDQWYWNEKLRPAMEQQLNRPLQKCPFQEQLPLAPS